MKKSENQNQKHLKLTTLGFTLIELLAVIVILAIISLIATPLILNVIEDTKKKSAEVSAYGYVDAVEKQVAINQLDTDTTNDIIDKMYNVSELTEKNVSVKGTKPIGNVTIEKGQVVSYKLEINGYTVELNNGKVTVTKGEIEEKNGPIKEEAKETDTHKGIVYLDPTNLNKTCNRENSISTTGTKEGCMKWYIYDDSGDTYKMLLDHNTTAVVAWNSSGKNADGMKEIAESLANDTKTWNNNLNPRLITADEIAKITNNTSFNSKTSTEDEWYYFDSKNQSEIATSKGESAYAWLFDYTKNCTEHGCNINDLNTYGYWTSTPVYNSIYGAWFVYSFGYFYGIDVNNSNIYGLRPVITVSKVVLS